MGLWPPTNSMVGRAIIEIPVLQSEYRQRCAALFTNVWRLDWMAAQIDGAVSKILTLARTEQERNDWRELGRAMHARVRTRDYELVSLFEQP